LTAQQTQPDVIDELTKDHREALDLLKKITNTSSAKERRDLADTVIAEVVRHSVAEEMWVYPAMRKHVKDGDDEVSHDIDEHKQLEVIMKKLEHEDSSSKRFGELVEEMTEALRHHAEDEENDQFPRLRKAVPREELLDLRKKVSDAKDIAPTRPHPGSPNSEVFHKLVGPGVGLVDRLRDKLSNRAA
jgi:hemerythrin-like domain-containing protein